MWHLPGTWWWNAKRSLTCCHVCVTQGNVCLCLICVSYCMCFRDRLHIHTWMHSVPATISSPDTRRHGNPLPSLSLLLFIYSFIYWLIFVPSPHPGIPQQRFRAEMNRRWDLIFSGTCHAIFLSATAARWWLPTVSPSRELKAEKARMKKSCIHLAGGTFWWHAADLFTRPGRRFCVICELNNSRIKKRNLICLQRC